MPKRRIARAALPLATLIAGAVLSVPACARTDVGPPASSPPASSPGTTMTARDLVTLGRVAAPTATPDGRVIVWQQSTSDPATLKRTTTLWRAIGGGTPAPITGLPAGNATAPAFGPDGRRLYFLAPGVQGKTDQLWLIEAAAPPRQVSHFTADIAGFSLSPDGHRVVVWGAVARDCPTLGCAGRGDTSLTGPGEGRLYRDGVGFVRHWDEWATPGVYNRAFAFTLDAGGAIAGEGAPLDGAAGQPGAITADVPTKPFGDGGDIAWAADSASVFFAARMSDRHEPTSTNLDIWQTRLDGRPAAPVNLTPGNPAMDALPAASPDGRWLAWGAMARAGYESDRMVVWLRDLKTGRTRALTPGWDRSAASLAWTPDSRALIATADDVLDHPAFRIDIASGAVTRLAVGGRGGHIGAVAPLAGGAMVITRDSALAPSEVWLAGKTTARQISHANDARLAAFAPVTVSRFHFAGAGDDPVWGMTYLPAGATGPLPVLLMVHGGPQGSFGDDWSFRWNPRLFAAQGYAVVTVDFHGSTGYGQPFTDSINRDWGGKPLEDLQKGLAAALAGDTRLDGGRVCALGASYGGYMMNWIEGNWPERFRCIVQHDGVFDARAMAYETEELWFDEWEHGGHPYYAAPDEFEKWNPVNHVAQWRTPMLVITSQRDFRIPYTQGLASFAALQRRNIPSELLFFPDETHWVTKPADSLQWHETVFAWLDRWLRH